MTQPLDVSCFRPIKGAWRKILRDWKQHNKGVIRKDHFPRLLKKALKEIESNREGIIKSAFEATGMVPLNREKVLSKLPKENVSASETEERMANSLKDIFQTQRFGKAGSAAVERKRKLKVEAGKSICVEDLVALRPQTSTMTENPRKRSNLRRDNKKTHKNIQKKDKYSHDSSSDTAEEEIVYEDSTDTETFSDLEERDLEPEDTRTEQHVVDGHLITETEEKESETEQDKNSEEVEQTENKNDTKKEIVNVNDYIITALTTTKGVTKKYVAKILERDKESFLCSFLRPSRKISGAFIFPDVEDISLVNQNEIKKKLDAPQNLRRGQLMFNNVKLI